MANSNASTVSILLHDLVKTISPISLQTKKLNPREIKENVQITWFVSWGASVWTWVLSCFTMFFPLCGLSRSRIWVPNLLFVPSLHFSTSRLQTQKMDSITSKKQKQATPLKKRQT